MGFGQAVLTGLTKYFTFAGRAPRSEYWYFYLFFLIAIIVGVVLDQAVGTASLDENGEYDGGPIAVIAVLGLFIPQISVAVRRLHDLNRSGWWLWLSLIPILGALVLLIWNCMRGTDGNNRYGPNPLNPVPVAVFD
jgi:uncharacterized membrane protein YhaH (DUF805 family)